MTQQQVGLQRPADSISTKATSTKKSKKSTSPSLIPSLIGHFMTTILCAFLLHGAVLLFGCRSDGSQLTLSYCKHPFISQYLTPGWVAATQQYEPPATRSLIMRLFTLSYRRLTADSQSFWTATYGKGPEDILFVVGCILIFAMVQHYAQRFYNWLAFEYLIDRSGKSFDNLQIQAGKFAEQAYLGTWYLVGFCTGYWLYTTQPYYPLFQRSFELWTDYPEHQLPGYIKLYYLVDASFWLQQLLQFSFFTPQHLRRKDHAEMTLHHVITSSLVIGSYALHFTRIGNVVLFVFYAADVFLCLAKCMKYTGRRWLQLACDLTFVVFVLTWIVTRHLVFFYLMWSIHVESFGVFEKHNNQPDPWFGREFHELAEWKRPGVYSKPVYLNVFLGLFAGLQTLLIIWLGMIFKVIVKVVSGKGADDVREEEDD
jgi:acyl-CoA-dependent ceramide synthase